MSESGKKSRWNTKEWVGLVTAILTVIGAGIGLGVGLTQNKGDGGGGDGTSVNQTDSSAPPVAPPSNTTVASTTVPDLYASGLTIGEGTYYVRSFFSGFPIKWDSSGSVMHSGSPLTYAQDEQWTVQNAGNRHVYFKSVAAGRYTAPDTQNGWYVQTTQDDSLAFKWNLTEIPSRGGLMLYTISRSSDNKCWDIEYNVPTRAYIDLYQCFLQNNQIWSFEPVGSGIQAGVYSVQQYSSGSPLLGTSSGEVLYGSSQGHSWKVIPVDTNKIWIFDVNVKKWLTYVDNQQETNQATLADSPADLWLRQPGNTPGVSMICQAGAGTTRCIGSSVNASASANSPLSFVPTTETGSLSQWFNFTLSAYIDA